MSDRYKWNYFPNLKNASELDSYIKNRPLSKSDSAHYADKRAFAHDSFYHYTTLESINKILSDNSFLLSKMGSSNDPMEKTADENVYCLCFSTGINENLPLWYLYSGIDGKGGRIGFSAAKIYKLIELGSYKLVEEYRENVEGKTENKYKEVCDLSKSDMEVVVQDILYAKENEEFCDLKYNTMTNHKKITVEEFKKFKENNRNFVKSLIWYYEKETRVTVKLKEPIIKNLSNDKKYKVKLSFDNLPEVKNNIKLTFAPQLFDKDQSETEYKNWLIEYLKKNNYDNIFNWIVNTAKFSPSEYLGQVEMKLCDKCEKRASQNK